MREEDLGEGCRLVAEQDDKRRTALGQDRAKGEINLRETRCTVLLLERVLQFDVCKRWSCLAVMQEEGDRGGRSRCW